VPANVDGQALPAVLVGNGQRFQRLPVAGPIRLEVVALHVIYVER